MVKFLFSVHTITEAKQSNRQGAARAGARSVDLSARSFDLARPGIAPPLFESVQCFCGSHFICIPAPVAFLAHEGWRYLRITINTRGI